MAFLSLIPAIGATLVWLPVAIYFLATGAIWQGVGLILYGVLVIGLVDNLLRPFLVGKGSKLPDYVVLISTLGGIEVFGLNGFVIGPLIAAMFMVSWEIFAGSRASGAGRSVNPERARAIARAAPADPSPLPPAASPAIARSTASSRRSRAPGPR